MFDSVMCEDIFQSQMALIPYVVYYASYEILASISNHALFVRRGIVHTWLNPKWLSVRILYPVWMPEPVF